MKINWGTGVVISFVLFISFIMYMVVIMMSGDKSGHDLVTPDYYNKGTNFQKEIDAEKNAQKLTEKVSVKNSKEGIIITFPKKIDYKKIKGTVSFYRPSNKNIDFDIPIELTNYELVIPNSRLPEGRWNITVDWIYEEVRYLYKDKITY
ncbi:MAG: FixH family protein [Flavobacteriaceae bacterium]|nr:FixH family protein [Flavobacteriaceae bacterium]